ncbi:hypothetical protein C1X65_09820 [Pseudomonas sp. FW305-70]|nr:hypothetical protein C1X65_09820 [Pseudomonas sp. FW305-70]
MGIRSCFCARLRFTVHSGGARSFECGSGLARESGVTVNDDVECYGPFASKPAPTGSCAQ